MNKYNIEYKDWSDFGCGEVWKGRNSKEAVINCQKNLIKEGNLMTKLVEVWKVEEEKE